MDDASEVGRYGVLRLMKRKEPDSEVTSFPIDSEEVTFGRNPDCSIRLYYPTVSGMHARIFFQESKVRSSSVRQLLVATAQCFRLSCFFCFVLVNGDIVAIMFDVM